MAIARGGKKKGPLLALKDFPHSFEIPGAYSAYTGGKLITPHDENVDARQRKCGDQPVKSRGAIFAGYRAAPAFAAILGTDEGGMAGIEIPRAPGDEVGQPEGCGLGKAFAA